MVRTEIKGRVAQCNKVRRLTDKVVRLSGVCRSVGLVVTTFPSSLFTMCYLSPILIQSARL